MYEGTRQLKVVLSVKVNDHAEPFVPPSGSLSVVFRRREHRKPQVVDPHPDGTGEWSRLEPSPGLEQTGIKK